MIVVLPSSSALQRLAQRAGREPNDPGALTVFPQLVLRGHLKPFVPDWWELIRWGQAERIARG